MKNFLLAAFGIAILSLTAASADARPWHGGWDQGWHGHGYGHGHGWGYGPRYHGRDVYIYNPAPVYVASAPAYTSRRIVCTQSYNPLPAILGGAAGGIVGNQIGKGSGRVAATIGGVLIGGMLTGQYGAGAQDCAEEVFTAAAPGTVATWQGPGDDYYSVKPTSDYETAGRYCREYQSVSTIGGQRRETYGTACMQPGGSWEIIN